jgi:putative transposase
MRIKGEWYCLYFAIGKDGQTFDFWLTERRDRETALRFLTKAIRRTGVPTTRRAVLRL